MKWGYNDDASDLVHGRREMTLVLLDRNGKELARKWCSFGGNDKRAEETGTSWRAKELYRDAFMVQLPDDAPPYEPPKPITRDYLWGLIRISRSPYA